MKIYVSAPKKRRADARTLRDQIRASGHEPLCKWIDMPDAPDDGATPAQPHDGGGLDPAHGSDMSFQDGKDAIGMKSTAELFQAAKAAAIFEEILDCDGLVVLTDILNHTREEAYGEYTMALALAKRVWIIGGRFHTMHFYKNVIVFPTTDEFLAMLKAMGVEGEREQQGG